MTTTNGTGLADPCLVLAAAASALAVDSADDTPDSERGLSPALAGVVADLGLRSAVLRAADGALLAVAGEVVHAVPSRRDDSGAAAVVELPVASGGATLTVVGATPPHLPLLRALCAVLGLALARRSATTALALALLDAADADADAAADALHDGPVQELVFARFAADAAARGGDPASSRDAVQSALQSLRRALWQLRPRGADGGLASNLRQLSDRLVESGRPGLSLDLDAEAADALGSYAASVCYRLAQAAARSSEQPTAVRVRRVERGVQLQIDAAEPLAGDRWTARARALGASLTTEPPGRTLLTVPVSPPVNRTDPARPLPTTDIEATL